MKKRKLFRIIWFSFITLFMVWNWTTFQARNVPNNTFENSAEISVSEDEDKITFRPSAKDKKIELLFFQGGLADPEAYAPLCRNFAKEGFVCHLIKMSWRLPQYDYQKITKLFDLASGNYVIGGHSQGAKMAAQVVFENQNLLKGLFLLGTSHPRDISLAHLTIPVLKLYASNDGLASVEEVLQNRSILPATSKFVLIEGGNHSQFGYLGHLLLDDRATISLEEQQQETLKQVSEFLNGIDLTNSQKPD